MTAPYEREIVIEIERVQVIKRRAKTRVHYCTDCNLDADFVSLAQAADIFGTYAGDLLAFVRNNQCHFRAGVPGDIVLCLNTLLSAIKLRQQNSNIKQLGESK